MAWSASITPTTNPTSTIINNSIAIVAAGNSVTFNVHPNARRVSVENIQLLNRAIVAAGGPQDLITATPHPTLESAKELMAHPDARVLLVTGGPGVVREALRTSKKAITAGPGNPPAVVDQTADIEKAGADIVRGASFDNNVICTDEKTTIVVDTVADRLVQAMAASGAYRLKEHEIKRLERVIFKELGPPNKPGRRESDVDRQGCRCDPRRDRRAGAGGHTSAGRRGAPGSTAWCGRSR